MKFCDVNFSWYLVNVFFDAFLDYSKCPDDNRYCYFFQSPHFCNLNFQIFILQQFLCYFYLCISVGGDCHIYQHACLFLLIFNNDVRFISFDCFITVYLHISENGNIFIFCNSFWLVLVPLIICFDVVML